jgi:hypothetical protein
MICFPENWTNDPWFNSEEPSYIMVTWPEIQDFMEAPDYLEKVYIGTPLNDGNEVWFVPKEMYYEHNKRT